MLTPEQKVQRILEDADTETLASYAFSYLMAVADMTPELFDEEYDKYFPTDEEAPQ